ncbi:Glucanosyltransferase-domain-containing protein [Amylocarpus encephaloides]|uniref:1,3-beta-glucanosyltransferase n=1 Tax=Amylocarpus encephaloides TaxID=45428 RepID=A0A9P8C1S6_9HELO|nr:Glucanosyltransferase-domain-containing protein [Amylocarpus encephaloides]
MLQLLLRAALILVASAAIPTVTAIAPISVKGSKFFANGQQFFLKGVAYQGTPDDPLVTTSQCQLDASLMKTIGTNSIRVYHVDPLLNHDGCMKAFADAGIYVWLSLPTFNTSIESTNPYWSEPMFSAYTKIVDAMQGYENMGGFWIGNEVVIKPDQSLATPVVRAAAADMKAYIALKNYRKIPVGYSAADIAELSPMVQNYLACDPDPANNIDFFGLNSYRWCGESSYQISGYDTLQAAAKDYPIPIFFSETGCNQPAPRLFTDQAAIFGPDMVNTWSGSIIYEWVQEVNNFGLVNYGPNGQIYGGPPAPMQPGFDNLANQWKNITPNGVAEAAYTPSLVAPPCPAATAGWQVNGNVVIPTLAKQIIAAAASGISPTSAPTAGSQTNGTLPPNAPAITASAISASSAILSSSSISTSVLATTPPSAIVSSIIPLSNCSCNQSTTTSPSSTTSAPPSRGFFDSSNTTNASVQAPGATTTSIKALPTVPIPVLTISGPLGLITVSVSGANNLTKATTTAPTITSMPTGIVIDTGTPIIPQTPELNGTVASATFAAAGQTQIPVTTTAKAGQSGAASLSSPGCGLLFLLGMVALFL